MFVWLFPAVSLAPSTIPGQEKTSGNITKRLKEEPGDQEDTHIKSCG